MRIKAEKTKDLTMHCYICNFRKSENSEIINHKFKIHVVYIDIYLNINKITIRKKSS